MVLDTKGKGAPSRLAQPQMGLSTEKAIFPLCGGQWDTLWIVPTWHMLPVCPHRHLLSDPSSHMHIPSAVQGPQHLVIGARMDADQGDPSRLEMRRARALGSRRHTRNCSRPAGHAAGWSRSHKQKRQSWGGSLVFCTWHSVSQERKTFTRRSS